MTLARIPLSTKLAALILTVSPSLSPALAQSDGDAAADPAENMKPGWLVRIGKQTGDANNRLVPITSFVQQGNSFDLRTPESEPIKLKDNVGASVEGFVRIEEAGPYTVTAQVSVADQVQQLLECSTVLTMEEAKIAEERGQPFQDRTFLVAGQLDLQPGLYETALRVDCEGKAAPRVELFLSSPSFIGAKPLDDRRVFYKG